MDEIKRQREQLDELHRLVNSLNIFVPSLPAGVFTCDLYSMLERITYLKGYLDSMLLYYKA